MRQYFETAKWQPIIENFSDILKIAICIIDSEGKPVIFPSQNRYGWEYSPNLFKIQENYTQIVGGRFEFIANSYLYYYAIPFKSFNNNVFGYAVLGPIILNKRLTNDEIEELSKKSGDDIEEIKEKIEEIRVISQFNLEQILNMVISFIQLSQDHFTTAAVNSPEADRTRNIFQSMLDLSLAIANADSGSVMLFNSNTKELSISVAKGLDSQYLSTPIKLTDGVSGIAFQKNRTFVIDSKPESELKGLLKRQEIKQSIVMPFKAPNQKASGVLNLNIMQANKGARDRLGEINTAIERITANVLQAI